MGREDLECANLLALCRVPTCRTVGSSSITEVGKREQVAALQIHSFCHRLEPPYLPSGGEENLSPRRRTIDPIVRFAH